MLKIITTLMLFVIGMAAQAQESGNSQSSTFSKTEVKTGSINC